MLTPGHGLASWACHASHVHPPPSCIRVTWTIKYTTSVHDNKHIMMMILQYRQPHHRHHRDTRPSTHTRGGGSLTQAALKMNEGEGQPTNTAITTQLLLPAVFRTSLPLCFASRYHHRFASQHPQQLHRLAMPSQHHHNHAYENASTGPRLCSSNNSSHPTTLSASSFPTAPAASLLPQTYPKAAPAVLPATLP